MLTSHPDPDPISLSPQSKTSPPPTIREVGPPSHRTLGSRHSGPGAPSRGPPVRCSLATWRRSGEVRAWFSRMIRLHMISVVAIRARPHTNSDTLWRSYIYIYITWRDTVVAILHASSMIRVELSPFSGGLTLCGKRCTCENGAHPFTRIFRIRMSATVMHLPLVFQPENNLPLVFFHPPLTLTPIEYHATPLQYQIRRTCIRWCHALSVLGAEQGEFVC